MYNDQLVYKVVIWAVFLISLWKEKVALSTMSKTINNILLLHTIFFKHQLDSNIHYKNTVEYVYCDL